MSGSASGGAGGVGGGSGAGCGLLRGSVAMLGIYLGRKSGRAALTNKPK